MHLETSLFVPFLSSIIEVDLNGLNSHHAEHAFNEIKHVQSRANERDNRDADKGAIESEVLQPIYILFLALAYPAVLRALLIQLTYDEISDEEEK